MAVAVASARMVAQYPRIKVAPTVAEVAVTAVVAVVVVSWAPVADLVMAAADFQNSLAARGRVVAAPAALGAAVVLAALLPVAVEVTAVVLLLLSLAK
jgi:hypothetical protein